MDEAAKGVEFGDVCTYISPTPIYHEMPQFPCEERHHHMSDMSDSTEDRETSTTKTELRLQQPLRHLRQVL